MTIHVLPDEVASQIAAGEVIERPASVVKELLENALDAHARQITIRIEKAGRGLIEVADDGDGIPADELVLAVGRHATSKLRTAEDLFHITTLGFRGEALASIASVARLTLTTRQPLAEVGARLQGEAGRMGKPEQIGVPAGTVVRVEDLFFNVPARLKFLKQDATERQQIDALVTRYAMAYPDVRMQLSHDGRSVIQTSGNGKKREVLANLYGVDIARQMLEIDFEEEMLRVTGFSSPVALTRSNRRELTFFVNGRWVQEIALNTALLQAYHTLLMVGRYPMAVIFIEIEPEEVDVNVHPAKAEVRFRQQDKVFSAVQRAVRRALLAYSPVPQLPIPSGNTSSTFWPPRSASQEIDPAWEMGAQLTGTETKTDIQSEVSNSGSPTSQSGMP
ncbi:MAG TPA: DNA mismatch repair endonuclease MutL, partial [Anaerolineaceae bacterium]|nr:DNA mismatch repair endonuclease MutL [Anaerolineaceae bacterium]